MSGGYSFTSWEMPTRNGPSGGGGLFLKLEPNKVYKVRLIGNPLQYFQHWAADGCPIACRAPEPRFEPDGSMRDPLEILGFTPKPRWSIWVFDRNDGNKIKIMDLNQMMYETIARYKVNFNRDPGNRQGPDWVIEGKLLGSNKRNTKWTCEYLDPAPFTEEEEAAIKNGNLKERLLKERAPSTPEEIRQKLVEKGIDPDGARQSPPLKTSAAAPPKPQPQPQPQPQTQKPAAKPKSDDDSIQF